MTIRVQTEDFNLASELALLQSNRADIGAIVSFIGLVRDLNDDDTIKTMTLEHYPGMTEKSLTAIEREAQSRWQLSQSLIIHRVGTLKPHDQIVLVAIASPHRAEAFGACEFIMDYLKTQAPFWKKEITNQGERWVEAKSSDDEALVRWNKPR
ncbi:MAG: molybdopterin synthase catalytic subunit MoaE [Methylophilaceae bacterium]